MNIKLCNHPFHCLHAKMKSRGGDGNELELNVKNEVRGTLSQLEKLRQTFVLVKTRMDQPKPGVRFNICIRAQLFKARLT